MLLKPILTVDSVIPSYSSILKHTASVYCLCLSRFLPSSHLPHTMKVTTEIRVCLLKAYIYNYYIFVAREIEVRSASDFPKVTQEIGGEIISSSCLSAFFLLKSLYSI